MRDLPRALLAAGSAVLVGLAPLSAGAEERDGPLRSSEGAIDDETRAPAFGGSSDGLPPDVDPEASYAPDASAPTSRTDHGAELDPRARLRVLDRDLRSIAAEESKNQFRGILALIGGGLGIALGALSRETDVFVSTYFYVWGASGVARGAIALSLASRANDRAMTLSPASTRSPDAIEASLVAGESALERAARRARRARLLDGSINLAAGAAAVPLLVTLEDAGEDEFYLYFVIIGSSLSIMGGAVTLATRSDAERRWLAYQRARSGSPPTTQRTWELRGVPTPGGGMARLRARF